MFVALIIAVTEIFGNESEKMPAIHTLTYFLAMIGKFYE
jgi:hypothetical protein